MAVTATEAGPAVGDRVGELRVTEAGPRTLRLDAPQLLPIAALCAAVILLGIGFTRLVQLVNDPAKQWYAKDWWLPIAAGGLALLWVFGRDLGRYYTFDGDARAFTRRRWWFASRTWGGEMIRCVGVRIVHRGPYEVAILAIEYDGGIEPLTEAAADNRALKLPSLALRIAELLDAAVTRDGVPVHGGVELRRALDGISALAGSRDIHDLRINCPACKRRDVGAVSYEYHEQHYGVRHTTTWVKCLECGTHLHAQAAPDELAAMSLAQRDEVIFFRISLIKRALAFFSAILCLFPWVGFVVCLVSTVANWRTPAWPGWVSRIALAVALVVTIAATVLISR